MNKHIIIIGIVVLLLPAGLSGCTEYTEQMATIEGEVDKIEIINYSIITQKRVSWTLQYEKVNDGFVHGKKELQKTLLVKRLILLISQPSFMMLMTYI